MKETFLDASDNNDLTGPVDIRRLELRTPEDEQGAAASEKAEAGEQEHERLAENNRQVARKIEEDEEETARKKKPAAYADFNSEAGTAGLMAASDKGEKSGYKAPDESAGASGLGAAAPAAVSGSGTGTYGDFRNEWLSPRVNMSNNPGLRWWVDDMLISTLRQKSDSNIIYIKHGISHRQTMASGKTSQLLQARAQQIAAEMKEDPNAHRRFRKYQEVLGRLKVTDNNQTAKSWRLQEQNMKAQASAKAPTGP